jgi:hypothetical protein
VTSPKPELPIAIDSTMLTTFRACHQKFYDEFVLGLRPGRTSIHLHAGGAIAAGIEEVRRRVYNEKLPVEKALQHGYVAFATYWGDYQAPEDSYKTFFNCFRSICSYFERWDPYNDHIRPYNFGRGGTFEFSFAMPTKVLHPSGQPFLFCGRIDMLGEYLGKPCILDEKTMKSMSSSFAFQWAMRGQFIGYCKAVTQALNIKVDTAVIRGTALLKEEIKHIEAIQQYPDHLIARWERELDATLRQIVECWQTEHWDYNFGDTCTAWGQCPYTILCTARDPTPWYSDFTVRRWNPVLRDPTTDHEGDKPLVTVLLGDENEIRETKTG